MKTIDIVTSAFNEEECLPELFGRLHKVLSVEAGYSYRIIITDNGSHDSTWKVIEAAQKENSKILGIKLSRNFGLDAALTCGLDTASADIAIIMTSDLQDPPEVIPQLLRKYEEGFDQVLVKIKKRDSVPWARRMLSFLFYRVARKMTSGLLPESVSDFRLVSRGAYSSIIKLRESHRFIRGLGAWVGFKTTEIEIDRPPRFAGESKWLGLSLFRVVGLASRSILAYSAKPLAWVSGLGIIMSIFSILSIFGLAIFWIIFGVPFAGFGSLVGLMMLGFSLVMLCIGVLAQYMGLIYEEVKQRPLYLIENVTNSN